MRASLCSSHALLIAAIGKTWEVVLEEIEFDEIRVRFGERAVPAAETGHPAPNLNSPVGLAS